MTADAGDPSLATARSGPERSRPLPDAPPLQIVRSALFNLLFWLWTGLMVLAALPLAPFVTPQGMREVARFWMRGTQLLLRRVVGLDYEVRGLERLPPGPCIVASKHQSAWETLFFHLVRPDLVIGLKYELTLIPLFGWYLMRARNIRIDRGGAATALRSLLRGAEDAVAAGWSILIFPEGTRKDPGEPPDYKPGVAALYLELGVPVVPVALNSGLFWARRSFVKRPGRITVEFLEPIAPGLDRRQFMVELERRIEGATRRLLAGSAPGTEETA
ncbi:MAG TPA: lysophospholipid acyltransferase family protein [Geminicoccaceae bacterium]|nr:lysophospholipid acyltransferase family protein [Geminicoccaceae bacterium]